MYLNVTLYLKFYIILQKYHNYITYYKYNKIIKSVTIMSHIITIMSHIITTMSHNITNINYSYIT